MWRSTKDCKYVLWVFSLDLQLSKGAMSGGELVCYTPVFSVVTQRSSPQTASENRTIPFPLCLWYNEQTNHVQETWQYVSRRAPV